jgi:hypothetical protein
VSFYQVPYPWKGYGQYAVWKTFTPHEPEHNTQELKFLLKEIYNCQKSLRVEEGTWTFPVSEKEIMDF